MRNVTKELNEPTCPIYQGCEVVGQGPRSQAQAAAAAGEQQRRDVLVQRGVERVERSSDGLGLLALAGFVTMSALRAPRRRSSGRR